MVQPYIQKTSELSEATNSRKLNKTTSVVKLLILSFLMASFYWYSQMYLSYLFSSPLASIRLTSLKVSSILMLVNVVRFYKTKNKLFYNLLIVALLCHSTGDVLIEFNISILYALPFFLLGHLFYCIILFEDINFKKLIDGKVCVDSKTAARWQYVLLGVLLLVAVIVASMFVVNLFNTPLMCFSVLIYIAILSGLLMLSVLHPAGFRILFWGILLYVISDFIIGYNEFISPILDIKKLFSWPLYYLAQLSIVLGLLNFHINKNK